MKRARFSARQRFAYVVPDPSNPKRQIHEYVNGARYALVYSYGYRSAYGDTSCSMAQALLEVPDLAKEFVDKVWTEGLNAGFEDRQNQVPPPNGLRAFLSED